MSSDIKSLSKFLSYVLRHKPESIGLCLDGEGWAVVDDLIYLARKGGFSISVLDIGNIMALGDKQRFELSSDGLRVRALQGHSTKTVSRIYPEIEPPFFLYHGTAVRFLTSIGSVGLIRGQRHHVHLAENEMDALKIGARYGAAVALQISSKKMFDEGYRFYQAENGVWLTLLVPASYINNL